MNEAVNNTFDPDRVGYAARLLGISELDLFKKAYCQWYGEEPSEVMSVKYVNEYLADGTVPFWMRNYVRTILSDTGLRPKAVKKNKHSDHPSRTGRC